jgi:tripartite-type tricarboxylate transporter receptor subunit TctC
MIKKTAIRRLALGLMALTLCSVTFAQTYPNRPLRAVIPWPPGQATDLVGRVIAQKLSEVLGQPVVPENRAGAGGMMGTVTVNPLLQKTPYDVERDFIPVAKMGLSPYLLVTAANFPAANAREFVNLVKSNPGKYSFASSGTGATAHIVAEWFNQRAGLTVTHVPYKGSAPALTDVTSGQVAYATETVAATMPLVRAGRLRAYGISLAKPSALAPGIEPLATSLNLPGFDVGAWIGIMVATGTPKAVVDRLSAAMATVMQAPDVRERLVGVGLEVDYAPADEFGRYLKEQQTRFAEIIKSGNIKVD